MKRCGPKIDSCGTPAIILECELKSNTDFLIRPCKIKFCMSQQEPVEDQKLSA